MREAVIVSTARAPIGKAVHKALVAAGHDVTLIVPLTNQSGTGNRGERHRNFSACR